MAEPPPAAADAKRVRAAERIAELERRLKNAIPPDALRLELELARLHEWYTGNAKAAGSHYRRAQQADPTDLPAIRGAHRAAAAAGDEVAAVACLEAELAVTRDTAGRVALLTALGAQLEDALKRPAEAVQAYERALALSPAEATALLALERLQRRQGDTAALDSVLARRAGATGDARLRAILLVRRAQLVRGVDPQAETELCQQALRLEPGLEAAASQLEPLLREAGRWRALIAVLERRASMAREGAERAALRHRIARIHHVRLDDAPEAIQVLERALSDAPGEPLLLDALIELHQARRSSAPLREALQRRLELTSEPGAQRQLTLQLAYLCEVALQDPPAAIRWYEAALELEPRDRPVIEALERCYRAEGDYGSLVRLKRTEVEATTAPEARAAALCELGEILDARLGRPEEAVARFREALALTPDDPVPLRALDRLYAVTGKHRERASLHQSALERDPQGPHRALHLLTIAQLHEETLGEPELACQAYEQLLEVDVDEGLALVSLQRASQRAGRHHLLVAALEREAAKADATEAASLLTHAAAVLEGRADDPSAAIRMLERVLELSPGHGVALSMLSRLLYAVGRWEALDQVIQLRVDGAATEVERGALRLERALLVADRLGEPARAGELTAATLAERPGDARAMTVHADLLARLGRHEALAKLWKGAIDTAPAGPDRARALCRLGLLHEERLKEPARAFELQQKALEEAPELAIAKHARARLDRREPRAQARDRMAQAEAEQPGERSARAFLRAGIAWTGLASEAQSAVACFERCLEQDPGAIEALAALELIHDRSGDRSALEGTYRRLTDAVTEAADRAALLHQRLRLLEHGKEADELAARRALLELAHAARPGCLRTLAELEAVVMAQGDADGLAAIDRAREELGDDPRLLALGRLRRGEQIEAQDPSLALQAYRAALELDATNLGALEGLARVGATDPAALELAAERARRAGVARGKAAEWLLLAARLYAERKDADGERRVLAAALETNPESSDAAAAVLVRFDAPTEQPRLLELLRSAAARASDSERAAQLWLQTAEVQRRLGDLAGARSAIQRARKRRPDDALVALTAAELELESGQAKRAEAMLRKVVSSDQPPAQMLRAYRALARVYADALDDRQRALACLRSALAHVPDDPDTLREACTLHLAEAQWTEARDAAQSLARAVSGPAARAEARVLEARAHRGAGNDEPATQCLAAAVRDEGALGEGMTAARELAQHTEVWQPLIDALESHAREAEGQGRLAALREAARILGDTLGKARKAAELIRKSPDYERLAELRIEHARWLGRAGDAAGAVAIVRALIEHEVWDARFWRELVRLHEASDDDAGARRAAAALCVLGRATGKERKLAAAAAHPQVDALEPEAVANLLPPAAEDAVANALLAALRPGLTKLYPADLEAYGVGPEQRVEEGTPLGRLAHRIATGCGVREYALYLHRVRTSGIALELSDPPVLLVPAGIIDLPEAQQRFVLARPLLAIASGLEATEKLTARELEVLLAAGARLARRDFGRGLTGEDELTQQTRSLSRALGWLGKRQVEPMARAYADGPRPEPIGWADAHQRRLNRAALLFAGDLEAAVEALSLMRPHARGANGESWSLGDPQVADLLRFWATEAASHEG